MSLQRDRTSPPHQRPTNLTFRNPLPALPTTRSHIPCVPSIPCIPCGIYVVILCGRRRGRPLAMRPPGEIPYTSPHQSHTPPSSPSVQPDVEPGKSVRRKSMKAELLADHVEEMPGIGLDSRTFVSSLAKPADMTCSTFHITDIPSALPPSIPNVVPKGSLAPIRSEPSWPSGNILLGIPRSRRRTKMTRKIRCLRRKA